MSEGARPTGLLRVVILLVGAHSVLLGHWILLFPNAFTERFGFPQADSIFFPTQTGAFLIALGVCYLLALRRRALVWTILVSKTVAVLFLFGHYLLLDAPTSVLAAGFGDAVMLGATVGALVSPSPTSTSAGDNEDGAPGAMDRVGRSSRS